MRDIILSIVVWVLASMAFGTIWVLYKYLTSPKGDIQRLRVSLRPEMGYDQRLDLCLSRMIAIEGMDIIACMIDTGKKVLEEFDERDFAKAQAVIIYYRLKKVKEVNHA